MKAYATLPEGCTLLFSIHLQKDRRLAFLINGLALVIAACMAVPVAFLVPMGTLFDLEAGLLPYALRFVVLLFGMGAYMVLHEWVHGAAMRLCGTKKVHYGFTGLYAYAGSEDYYDKSAYVFIALAPVVLFGLLLAVACLLVPVRWFWVVYIIQITNICGAAGDFYVSARFARLPKNILVQDSGVGMRVYSGT